MRDALAGRELIPEFHIDTPTAAQQASEKKKQTEVSEKPEAKRYPEPFEKIRSQLIAEADLSLIHI